MFNLIVCVLLCLSAGSLGSIATMASVQSWYPSLNKPDWTPPAAWFGPVWTILYILMGIALWLIWESDSGPARTQAIWIFGVQLILNSIWSFLFFGLKSPLFGLVGIILLDVAVLLTIWKFMQIRVPAGLLLIPYLAWILFASVLNFSIFQMNQ
ncbi:TspO/MBR family protein [Kamptonema cortianum]|nr:TspO/MBR family protein [Geitlerinema splendidum]MDK3157093.1 TspO/MBR family protein [Kamptonema cortianum]